MIKGDDRSLHIIHLSHRGDRLQSLMQELSNQKLYKYRIWSGIIDDRFPCRGILRAHQQIIHWANQQGVEEVCIAEEDVQFSSLGAFDYFLSQKPSDYDLYLGGITWGIFENTYIVREFSGAMLYIAHQRFYETILSLHETKNFDRMMAGRGRFVLCSPMVACQHDGFSDNSQRHLNFESIRKKGNWFRQENYPFLPE